MAIESLAAAGMPLAIKLPEQTAGRAAAARTEPRPPRDDAAAVASHRARLSQERVEEAIRQVQELVQAKASSLQFSVDRQSGKTIVKLVDDQTGELIRQIPSEEMLELAQSLDRLQGLLFTRQA